MGGFPIRNLNFFEKKFNKKLFGKTSFFVIWFCFIQLTLSGKFLVKLFTENLD